TPSLSYADLRRQQEAINTEIHQEDNRLQELAEEKANKEKEFDFEKKLKPYLDLISGNFLRYAEAMQEPKPNSKEINQFIRDQMRSLELQSSDKMSWEYVIGLVSATNSLAEDGERIAKNSNAQKLPWDNWVGFLAQY